MKGRPGRVNDEIVHAKTYAELNLRQVKESSREEEEEEKAKRIEAAVPRNRKLFAKPVMSEPKKVVEEELEETQSEFDKSGRIEYTRSFSPPLVNIDEILSGDAKGQEPGTAQEQDMRDFDWKTLFEEF